MLQNGFDRSLSKKQCSLMLFELVSCQKQGMRINRRILPKFFVRRVCNKAIAESLVDARILLWESLVSMLEEKYSYSWLLGPTAVALLNGVDHRALCSKAIFLNLALGWAIMLLPPATQQPSAFIRQAYRAITRCLLASPRLQPLIFVLPASQQQFNHHGHIQQVTKAGAISDQGLV